jgi:hypothetical protein
MVHGLEEPTYTAGFCNNGTHLTKMPAVGEECGTHKDRDHMNRMGKIQVLTVS